MKPEIRNLKSERLLSAGLCSLCWQGDFGKGVATGSGVFSEPGANPCLLYSAASHEIPAPQFKLGMVIEGDNGAEFIFAKLVLSATTDLLPGQVYELDENFGATLLTTADSVLNREVGVLNVWAPGTVAGSYFIWLQRAGHAAVQAAATSIATGQAETTATAGQVNFLASGSHTAGTKSTGDVAAFAASQSITFTGTTTAGSPFITNVVSSNSAGGVADLTPGMAFTMTGFTNAIIAGIDKQGGLFRILVGTNTAGAYAISQNATAGGGGVAGTVTSHVIANLKRPSLSTQN